MSLAKLDNLDNLDNLDILVFTAELALSLPIFRQKRDVGKKQFGTERRRSQAHKDW